MKQYLTKNKNAFVIGITMLLIGYALNAIPGVFIISQSPAQIRALRNDVDTAKIDIIRIKNQLRSKVTDKDLKLHEYKDQDIYARKDVVQSEFKGINEKLDLLIKLSK